MLSNIFQRCPALFQRCPTSFQLCSRMSHRFPAMSQRRTILSQRGGAGWDVIGMFLFAGAGPFPGVIDMFGTAGGLTVYRAALLASRGFAALALAFFNFDDLPPNIELH